MLSEQMVYRRVYVIGDIHGRSDLLDSVVKGIQRDLDSAGESEKDCLTVTLGDYLDRGPDSRGVLDRLSRNPFPTRYIALKGNHEELFEGFLRDTSAWHHWWQLGGLQTLNSYGIAVTPLMMKSDLEAVAVALRAAVPLRHQQFLSSLQPSLELDRYFLCHAGIRPGIPFDQQSQNDLLWIREEFLSSTMSFGKIVIHGHTPVRQPEILWNRINIDTAAFATGRLTCLVLEGPRYRFLTT